MKKGRYKYHHIQVPLYYSALHVIIADDLAAAYVAAGFDDSEERDINSYGAMAWDEVRPSGHAVFALFRPTASAGSVAHETVHLVNYLFRRKGIKLDTHNDEPQAYLTAWIVNEINYALTSKKVKAKDRIKLK